MFFGSPSYDIDIVELENQRYKNTFIKENMKHSNKVIKKDIFI